MKALTFLNAEIFFFFRLDLKKKRSSCTQLSGSSSDLAAGTAGADDCSKSENSLELADEQPSQTGTQSFIITPLGNALS